MMMPSVRFGRPGLVPLVALACTLSPPSAVGQEAEVSLPLGTSVPAASVEDLEGNPVQLLDLTRGKPALVEIWATWCEQCEALQPQLDALQVSHGDRVNIVAVAVGVAQTARRVQRHLESHDPGYPYVFDARGEAVRAFGAFTTSTVVILDAEGKVAYTGVGPDQRLEAAVEKVLGEG